MDDESSRISAFIAGIVGRHHVFGEVQLGQFGHQPAAQGPGAVVAAADRQDGFGHGFSSGVAGTTQRLCQIGAHRAGAFETAQAGP
jgi:hypothetical protein